MGKGLRMEDGRDRRKRNSSGKRGRRSSKRSSETTSPDDPERTTKELENKPHLQAEETPDMSYQDVAKEDSEMTSEVRRGRRNSSRLSSAAATRSQDVENSMKLKRGDKPKSPQPATSNSSVKFHVVTPLEVERESSEDDDGNEELSEEERRLQELRIELEINKLSDIKEIVLETEDYLREMGEQTNIDSELKGTNGRENSDDDSESDGDEDELEFRVADESESRCPPPAPRKARASRPKFEEDEQSKLERLQLQQEMCELIKNSINRDSIFTPAKKPTFLDEVGTEERDYGTVAVIQPQQQQVVLHSGSTNEADNPRILYQKLRNALDAQEKWLKQGTVVLNSFPMEVVTPFWAYNYHNMKINSIDRQLQIEHLCWIAIQANIKDNLEPIQKDGLVAWLPEFQKRFCFEHPTTTLTENAAPNSSTNLDLMLKTVMERVLMQIENVEVNLFDVHDALLKMLDIVKVAGREKRRINDAFENVHDELAMRNVKFDETTAWGLRYIRIALEPPYFKTDDGALAAPMFPDGQVRLRNYPMCFFKRDKQKWTTKDLGQLKDCIKEVLQIKRFNLIRDRYEVLMVDCINQYEMEVRKEGRLDAPPLDPLRRKRGRPKKSELELTTKYGLIRPVIAYLPNGIVLRSEITPRLLSEWRTNEEKKIRGKSYEELVYLENEHVDWIAVSNKIIVKSRKYRTPQDCELAWRHEVHPKVFNKRWGADESYALRDIYDRVKTDGKEGIDWHYIANELNQKSGLTAQRHGAGRTAYQCFFRIRNRIEPPKKLEWTDELDGIVLEKIRDHAGNWRLVTASLDNPIATKRQVIERYKKTINPILRNGAFTRVEDCLLILTIEKLKPFLAQERHFGCLLTYLPWRCETTWRDRANNLFSDWIVPWTIEEDRKLMDLAVTMSRNWQKISEQFVSFKNRKGCLTRYKILKKRLKEPKFNGSLEAYHEAYSMTRYNVFQYKHLKVILKLLLRVQKVSLPEEHQNFVGLLRDRAPSEVRLQHMLLTFDKDILNSTIASLARYIQSRDKYWREWIEKHGERRKTFDRRTFHPENPQSVASALHIRGLELKKKSDIENISDWENEIYKFYARFCRTKDVDKHAERRYIPDARTLMEWSAVSRLIVPPPPEILEKKENWAKNKWESLDNEFPFKNGKALRPKKRQINPTGQGPSMKSKHAAHAQNLLKSAVHRVIKQKKPRGRPPNSRKRKVEVRKKNAIKKQVKEYSKSSTDDQGYLLVPAELQGTRKKSSEFGSKKSNKRRKNEDDSDSSDPEFQLRSSQKATKFRRRSSRKVVSIDLDAVD